MELPIYQRQNECVQDWADRAFHYATQRNPTLSLQELDRLSGWIFTEGITEPNLRQRVRESECSGLAVAVGFAWQTQQDEARWAARRFPCHDNWSTVGVVGYRDGRSTVGVVDPHSQDDNWSTVGVVGYRDNRSAVGVVMGTHSAGALGTTLGLPNRSTQTDPQPDSGVLVSHEASMELLVQQKRILDILGDIFIKTD